MSDDEPNRGGRPVTVMTEATKLQITRLVQLGLRPDQAARAANISPSSMRSCRSRDEAFDDAIETAAATCEAVHVGAIASASKGNWTASAWLLERRFSERWARPEVRASLSVDIAKPMEIAAAIHAALQTVASIHNPPGAPDVEDLVPGPPRHPHEIAAEEAQRLELERQRVVEQRARDGALVTEPSPTEQFVPLQHQFSRDEIVAATARDALRRAPR